MSRYHRAILKTIPKYKELAKGDEKLSTFIEELEEGCKTRLPINKMNRWLGYIQGVLIERGLTTVNEERDFTRPLFRPLDFASVITKFDPDVQELIDANNKLHRRAQIAEALHSSCVDTLEMWLSIYKARKDTPVYGIVFKYALDYMIKLKNKSEERFAELEKK